MKWRPLMILPLAAVCVGDPATAPSLRPQIPQTISASCSYDRARKNFLLAYAYKKNKPAVARYFCDQAFTLEQACGPEAAELRARTSELCDIPLAQ
jgi:hypothetical protein